MAINVKNQYPVGTNPPDADYPEGSAVSSTTPTSKDGFPFAIEYVNDMLGFLQSILREANISANDVVDTARASQYFRGLIELSAGRATNYIDSGIANAYVVGPSSNQQAPMSRFNGRVIKFIPINTNTGASTVNVFSEGVDDIKLAGGVVDPLPGQIEAGVSTTIIDRLSYYELETPLVDLLSLSITVNATADANITVGDDASRRGLIDITDTGAVLTAQRSVIVGDKRHLFVAKNSTSQDLLFKTASGSGIVVLPGNSSLLLVDGVDVLPGSAQVAANIISDLAGKSAKTIDIINNHPKAVVNFNAIGAIQVFNASNVSSVSKTSAGTYQISFSTPMQNENYGIHVTSRDSFGYGESLTINGFTVRIKATNTGVLVDSDIITVTVYSLA